MRHYKARKADWVQHCKTCNITSHHVDEFGAYAATQKHEEQLSHSVEIMKENFQPLREAFTEMGERLAQAKNEFVKAWADTYGHMPTDDTSKPESPNVRTKRKDSE